METMMTTNSTRLGVKLAWFLMTLCGMAGGLGPAYGIERNWVKDFVLSPGGRVSVENVDGDIVVEGWDQAQVQATVAMRSAGAGDRLGAIQVAVEAKPGSLAFHTLYPANLEKPVRVDYRLRVPRQVQLEELSTLQGAIAVRDVEGSVKARSLHGDITGMDMTGSVAARTLTGNILISLRSLPDVRGAVRLETINGNLDLLVPAKANADVELTTVAGRILGSFRYEVSSVVGESTRRTRLGQGGAHIELRTVRGNIRVGERNAEL
jgi:hypothetical protein